MRMHLVVIGEPDRQLLENRQGIRRRVDIHVVTLEGFDKGFGHAVAMRGVPPAFDIFLAGMRQRGRPERILVTYEHIVKQRGPFSAGEIQVPAFSSILG